jgi:peptide/nickel transport system substrate-binding protein
MLLMLITIGACASPAPSTSPDKAGGAGTAPAGTNSPKTLTVLMNDEPKKLGPIGPGGGSLQSSATTPFFYEGFLIVADDSGTYVPRIATEIPTLENGDWRLLPSGQMETTWKLRPDVYWHDGTSFTASDVVFTWQVWRDPLSEVTRDVLSDNVDAIDTPDDHTIVVHWKSPFAFINEIGIHSLLPRHILEPTFLSDKELFNSNRWNTVDYVGLGPYRLKEWVPGSQLTLEAFDQYFLGRPKIQTIIARFVTDPNVLATTMLAGHADMNIPWGATADSVTPVQEGWKRSGEGNVYIYPGPSLRFITYQARDEFLKQPALKQPAVRQALLYALDKEALVDLLYQDRSLLADSWYVRSDPHRASIADGITSYNYDPRKAAQLLEQQGWKPGPDGVLVNAAGDRFETSFSSTSESGQAVSAFASYWRQAGIAVQEDVLTPAQTQDREFRAKFPGLEYTANVPIRSFLKGRIPIAQIPGPENRWTGSNRNGLAVSVLDDLMKQFDSTINDVERTRVERDLIREITGNAQFGFFFMYPHQWMVRKSVTGVLPSKVASMVDDWPRVTWNAHTWDIQQ